MQVLEKLVCLSHTKPIVNGVRTLMPLLVGIEAKARILYQYWYIYFLSMYSGIYISHLIPKEFQEEFLLEH